MWLCWVIGHKFKYQYDHTADYFNHCVRCGKYKRQFLEQAYWMGYDDAKKPKEK